MTNLREKIIENYLRNEVKKLNGRAYKWESPGNNGVPDRIIFLPGGKVYLVELKAPCKKPTALQKNQHLFLNQLGQEVNVIDSKEKVDTFIQKVRDVVTK